MREQPALAVDAAAIAGQRSIGTNETVTGNDHADRIGAVGVPDGADRLGDFQPRGERTVIADRVAADGASPTKTRGGIVTGVGVRAAAPVTRRADFIGPGIQRGERVETRGSRGILSMGERDDCDVQTSRRGARARGVGTVELLIQSAGLVVVVRG